ncbi:hypothetical protein MY3296_009906 [Beauveria thailandica]
MGFSKPVRNDTEIQLLIEPDDVNVCYAGPSLFLFIANVPSSPLQKHSSRQAVLARRASADGSTL